MRVKKHNFFVPHWPCPSSVKCVITYRFGGASKEPYKSNNLATHVGDKSEAVIANRESLKEKLALPGDPIWLNQIHGVEIIEVEDGYQISDGDGFYCRKKGFPCGILTADCLPILVCNTLGTEIAAIHAGWRGLSNRIIKNLLKMFHAPADQLLVYLGPAIGLDNFEVGSEVREYFLANSENCEHRKQIDNAFYTSKGQKLKADLYELARADFRIGGVKRMFGGEFCSFKEKDHFYSYRREKITGRNATLIWLE